MQKKLLAALLTLCMVLSFVPINVFAADVDVTTTGSDPVDTASATNEEGGSEAKAAASVAKVGNTEYATIDEAIANWTNGTTLTLLADVTLSDVIKLSSTENHTLNLGTYTMTAASGKDAIQYVVNGRTSMGTALTINADATNPGGITATGQSVISHMKPSSGAPEKDRPQTVFNGGVFNASYVVKQGAMSTGWFSYLTSGYTGASAPGFIFYGGTFNGTIYTNRSLNRFYGGTFNGSMQMSVDSSAYTQIAGGTFKNLSNSFGSSLNSDKFVIGTSKGANNGSVCIDENGNYVITTTTPSNAEASVASNYNSNNYFYYSTVNTNGMYYEDVYDALEGNKTGTVTVFTDELDLTDSPFEGTIVVPEGETITIVVEEGVTPTWTLEASDESVTYKDADGNELVKDEEGSFAPAESEPPVKVTGVDVVVTDYDNNSYDITLVDDGETWPEGGVQMTFPATGEMAYVVHEHNGANYIYVGTVVDGTITINNTVGFSTFTVYEGGLEAALNAAADMTGDVTVEIYDKVTLNSALSGKYDSIKFVGKDTDAEIYLDVQGYITATGKKVSFEDLTLSKCPANYVYNAGFMNVAFGVYDVVEVTYTDCTFTNGAYASSGKVTFTDCTFGTSYDKYGLWAYGDVDTTVEGCSFEGARGIKMYAEGAAKTVNLTVKNTDFSKATGTNEISAKPAIVLTYAESVTLEGNTYSSMGVFELDLDGAPDGTTVNADAEEIAKTTFTCVNDAGACGVLVDGKIYTTVAQAAEVATSGSTVTLLHDSTETVVLSEGVNLDKNGYTAEGVTVKTTVYVAEVGGVKYESLAEAVAAAQSGDTIVLMNGEYELPLFSGKELTFKGESKEGVIIDDAPDARAQGWNGSTFHFENLTAKGATENYHGLANGVVVVTYKDCDINGLRFLYATDEVSFDNCAFNANGVEHSFWTYGASKVTVTNCTFTYTDRAVNCYSENGANHELDISFSGCTFTYAGDAESPEGAVEINSGSVKSIDLTMDDCTAPAKGAMWFNSRWDGTGGVKTEVTVDGEKVWPIVYVAEVDGVKYETLAGAIAAADEGDVVTLLADVTLDSSVTLPAGITFNGNGKSITGYYVDANGKNVDYTVYAGGDITFAGHSKIASFNVSYTNTTINIGEGACLEIVGTGRLVIGHGCTFNINGTITDAKTADKATLTPSLIMPGASFTGAGVTFNVTNAYIKAPSSYCSSSKSASGTFDFNITNSIVETAGKLAFESQSTAATVNFELKDSVLTTGSHLVFGVSRGEIVIDNSNVNVGTSKQIENRSTMTIKNGSVVSGAVATSSNAINPGTIIVENATYAVTGQFSGSGEGTGTLVIKKGATVSVGSIVDKANIVIDATGMQAGDEINFTANLSKFAGTIEIVNNDKLEAKIVDGKVVLVEKTVASVTDAEGNVTNFATLEEAFKAATDGCIIDILADVTIDYKWDCRDYVADGSHSQFKESVTINGNGHTIKFTGTINDNNWNTVFRFEENATVNNLTIDISEATGVQRVITAKKSLTVDGLTIIGSARYGIIFGEGASAEDLANAEIVIKNSTLTGTRRAISDNEGGKDVKSVTITGNTLNANAYASASESIVFNNNTATGEVDLRSYTADTALEVEAKGNTLNTAVKNYIFAKTIDAQDEFTTARPAFKVSTKAELDAAIAAAQDGDTIMLTADIDYGTTQLAIAKAITLDLGGKTLTTRNAYGGMSVKNNPTIKNGTIVHASNTAAIKVWNAVAFEDLVIDVQGKGDANKTIGGIVLQSGSTTRVGSIKNVTIKGDALTNGIETYNCGDATENVIGSMENVAIDANGTGMLISAPCGTATNCSISGDINGIEIWIKGNYSASLDLVDSDVEGGVYAHDEFTSNPDVVNNGELSFTADDATTGADDITVTVARAENVGGIVKDVIDNAQAKVNDTYYSTLADAIAAAEAGATVTLLTDITVESDLANAAKGLYNIDADDEITIDLNGKTINVTDNSTGNFIVFYNYGDLTIKNGTVKLTATNNRAWNAQSTVILNRGGNLTIESGSYIHNGGTDMAITVDNSANSFGDAVLTINDGEITSTYTAVRMRMADTTLNGNPGNGTSTVFVEGGTIYGTKRGIWGQITDAYSGELGALTVTGGTVEGGADAVNIASDGYSNIAVSISGDAVIKGNLKGEGADYAVSGGTFSTAVSEELCAEGYIPTANDDGTYGVVVDPAFGKMVKVGDNYYDTIADALAKAKDDGVTDLEITIIGENDNTSTDVFDLYDQTTFDNVTIKQDNGNKPYYILDLYAGNRTSTEGKFVFDGVNIVITEQVYLSGDVVLKNNSIVKRSDDVMNGLYDSIVVEPGSQFLSVIDRTWAEIEVDGGKTDGSYNTDPSYKSVFVDMRGGALILKNGAYILISSGEGGNLDVKAGAIKATASKLQVFNALTLASGVSMEIDVASFVTAKTITGAGTITVDGSAFTEKTQVIKADMSNFTGTVEIVGNDALIYEITADGLYIDIDPAYGKVAQIGETYYETLADAIAAANDDDTVTLLAPIVVAAGETLTLDKAVTITYISNVPGEDMITNRGTLVIDGATLVYTNTDTTASNVTVSTISTEPGSTLEVKSGTVKNDSANNGALGIYAYAIDILTNGNLGDVIATISGGEVISTNYMAIRQFNNGTACKNTLVVEGGYIYGAKRAIQVHLKNDAAYLTISGGKVEAGEGGYALCLFPTDATNFSVTGGEFIGTVYSGTNGFISGGTFDAEPYDGYAVDGYVFVANEDGKYELAEAVELKEFFGANVDLGNTLDINYYILQSYFTGDEYYAIIAHTTPDGVVETRVEFEDWATNGSYYQITYHGIAAKQMSDAISVTVYSNDGTQISVTRNEGIRDYCMRVFASQTAEVQKLFVDMLNYGAAAQVQFTYNVDDLANALLSDEQKALATGEISYENTRVATANFVGTNFDLENSILLNYYFNNITTDMKARVTFTDFRGVEHEVIIDGSEFIKNGSAYQINISETVVADGRCGITCEILDGETVVESVTDSMESYVARVAADYPHLVEMLKFSDSASEYLLNRN